MDADFSNWSICFESAFTIHVHISKRSIFQINWFGSMLYTIKNKFYDNLRWTLPIEFILYIIYSSFLHEHEWRVYNYAILKSIPLENECNSSVYFKWHHGIFFLLCMSINEIFFYSDVNQWNEFFYSICQSMDVQCKKTNTGKQTQWDRAKVT